MKFPFLISSLSLLTLTPCAHAELAFDALQITQDSESGAVPYGLNDAGQVVLGLNLSPYRNLSLLWSRAGEEPILLKAPEAGIKLFALDLNEQGESAAAGADVAGAPLVIRTDSQGQVAVLGRGQGFGLNDEGTVVGYWTDAQGTHAGAWREAGKAPVELARLSGIVAEAQSISNTGRIAGWSNSADDWENHAVLWDLVEPSKVRDLGTLGGRSSYAMGISPNGRWVTGWSYPRAEKRDACAFAWSEDTGMKALAGCKPGYRSTARQINDRGWAVGVFDGRAALWREGELIFPGDLTPALKEWKLVEAYAINSRGQITVVGVRFNRAHAFVLTPRE